MYRIIKIGLIVALCATTLCAIAQTDLSAASKAAKDQFINNYQMDATTSMLSQTQLTPPDSANVPSQPQPMQTAQPIQPNIFSTRPAS